MTSPPLLDVPELTSHLTNASYHIGAAITTISHNNHNSTLYHLGLSACISLFVIAQSLLTLAALSSTPEDK